VGLVQDQTPRLHEAQVGEGGDQALTGKSARTGPLARL
jgi:hypothetical protein